MTLSWFIALFAMRPAFNALMCGPLVSIFPSGNPAIHHCWTRWLSVTRLPGFWLYAEERMKAFADTLPVFTPMHYYRACPPFFLDC